ncbi:MAG: dethiobiotin synthase [Thermoguttaceae bacterium]|nr:dethiobiotin synthase [Thermoguttaceae bacterium]
MSKSLFVTGTGTGVGKTFAAALILRKLHSEGLNAAYFKAAMSGNRRDENGRLLPGDALYVKKISGIRQPLESMCPYVYETAVSPHLAAKREGNPVELDHVLRNYDSLCRRYDWVVTEGSGGIVCPLRDDHQKIGLEDFVHLRRLSCLIVADAGLGTINAVVLTAEYMNVRHLSVKGIIFNRYEKGNFLHEDNLRMCEAITGIKVVAAVAEDASELDVPCESLQKLFHENGDLR